MLYYAGEQPSNHPLSASETSFYLLEGKPAVLPCTSWEPDDPACEVQWFKVDNSVRHILSYNLSTNDVGTRSTFDLASNFGLVIKSVEESHAGRYNCTVDIDRRRTVLEVIDVLVIGWCSFSFLLDCNLDCISLSTSLRGPRKQPNLQLQRFNSPLEADSNEKATRGRLTAFIL